MSLLNGLIAYYKLDGNAKDELGNYNGTPSNVSWVDGKIDKAGSFNGSNGYIQVPTALAFQGPISVSLWFKAAENNGSGTHTKIFVFGGLAFSYHHMNPTFLGAFSRYNGSSYYPVGKNNYIKDTWYNVIYVYDGTHHSVYINNTLKESVNIGNKNILSDPCFIGSNNSESQFFNGLIDEFAIYNRALTQQDRDELYNNGDGLSYPFSTSSGEIFIGGKRVKDIKLGSRQIKEVYKGDKLIFKI